LYGFGRHQFIFIKEALFMCPTYLVGNGTLTRTETLARYRTLAQALARTVPGGIVELAQIPRSIHPDSAFVVFTEDATAEIGAAAVLLAQKHPVALYGKTPDAVGLYLRDAVDSKSVVIEQDLDRAALYIKRALEDASHALAKQFNKPKERKGW